MTKTLLDRTVANAIHGDDITNQFKAKCKTAKDWKKLEQRCYRKGWMYKLFVDGYLWTKSGDKFVLFAEYSDREAIKFAFNHARFSRNCSSSEEGIPDYVLPFQLYNRDRLVYQYVPKTPKPNWEIYELYVPDDPYQIFHFLFYSKNRQTALFVAHCDARYTVLNIDGILATPDDYMPRPYQVLCNGEVVYDYAPPVGICINPDYLRSHLHPLH